MTNTPSLRTTQTLAIALFSMSLLSCQRDSANDPWQHWEVKSSIRTMDVLSEHHIRYGGSDGWVGQSLNDGGSWEHRQWMAPDSMRPSFRASSSNGQMWFAVGIASPAWIAASPLTSLEPTWVHSDTSKAVFLDAMAWWSETEGLVFGDPQQGCFTLLETNDSGQSWKQVDCQRLPMSMPGEAGFAASNGNIAIQGDTGWIFTGGQTSRCLRTLNRGQEWEAISLPIRQGETMTGVFAASFANSQLGLAIGGHWEHPEENRGNLIATVDGGETWELLAEGHGPGYRSSIVHHPVNPNDVVATGFLGIDVSHDGGATWKHVSDSSRYVARFSPSGRTLWLAGQRQISRATWPIQDP